MSFSGISSLLSSRSILVTGAGVAGVTRAAAIHYARRIRVNAVLPGGARTNMLEHAFTLIKGLREAVPTFNPRGRLAAPDGIAFTVRRRLSSEASFVTGVLFPVDGGLTAE